MKGKYNKIHLEPNKDLIHKISVLIENPFDNGGGNRKINNNLKKSQFKEKFFLKDNRFNIISSFFNLYIKSTNHLLKQRENFILFKSRFNCKVNEINDNQENIINNHNNTIDNNINNNNNIIDNINNNNNIIDNKNNNNTIDNNKIYNNTIDKYINNINNTIDNNNNINKNNININNNNNTLDNNIAQNLNLPKVIIHMDLRDFYKYYAIEKDLRLKKRNIIPKKEKNKKSFNFLVDKYTQPNKLEKDLIHNKFYEKYLNHK